LPVFWAVVLYHPPIRYTIGSGATFNDTSVLSGSFEYESATNTYQNVNITITGGTLGLANQAYTYIGNSTLSPSSTGTLLNLELTNPSAPLTLRGIDLSFTSTLPTDPGSSTTLAKGMSSKGQYTGGSFEYASNPGGNFSRGLTGDATVTATAVPWETDALPLVGATIAFGAGVFVKRKIAQGKIKNLNLEPVKSECLSNVG
jgi:hypothetical protein